jgi:hypothetical protein
MAEAALKYDFEQPETLMVPDGGLATFLTATEGAWADEEPFPQNGIAQVAHIADRLAEFGRHEDEYMVHAAEGETVIPMNVLDANPRLRKNLFAQMEKMGLEPERYVVGSELNSINPVTGQPEFFLKKLFKGVKKLVKKVVKVVKKALPIVLPIALSFTPLGPIWGAAMGSGIGTLAQGGSFRDALKSAVISGAIGGLTIGMKGGFKGMGAEGSGFGAGFKEAVGTAGGNVGERFGQFFGRPTGQPSGYWGAPGREILSPDQAVTQAAQINPNLMGPPAPITDPLQEFDLSKLPQKRGMDVGTVGRRAAQQQRVAQLRIDEGGKRPGQRLRAWRARPEKPVADWMFRGGRSAEDIEAARTAAGEAYKARTPLDQQTSVGLEAARATADPSMFAKYGPTAAIAGLGAAGMGFFSPPEVEDAEKTDEELEKDLRVDAEKYAIRFPATPQYGIPSSLPPISMAAQGGRIGSGFPRRSGAIAGPGTERSDDVPAMLSDGEFVMTAKAVRGAGNGSRNNGMSNMYQLMKNFEGAA